MNRDYTRRAYDVNFLSVSTSAVLRNAIHNKHNWLAPGDRSLPSSSSFRIIAESAYPDVTLSGLGCSNNYSQCEGCNLNQAYSFRGTTADGRPWYQGQTATSVYLFYDSKCAACACTQPPSLSQCSRLPCLASPHSRAVGMHCEPMRRAR